MWIAPSMLGLLGEEGGQLGGIDLHGGGEPNPREVRQVVLVGAGVVAVVHGLAAEVGVEAEALGGEGGGGRLEIHPREHGQRALVDPLVVEAVGRGQHEGGRQQRAGASGGGVGVEADLDAHDRPVLVRCGWIAADDRLGVERPGELGGRGVMRGGRGHERERNQGGDHRSRVRHHGAVPRAPSGIAGGGRSIARRKKTTAAKTGSSDGVLQASNPLMDSDIDTRPELQAAIEGLASDEEDALGARLEKQEVRARLFGSVPSPQMIGRFEVLRPLGRGGMGEVFAARDPELGRSVAIKLVSGASSEHAMERFAREGRALARLSHPNIVQVYEVGPYEGSMFIAMELVQGQTLQQWSLADDDGRPRAWKEVLGAYLDAGRGLAAAHAVGMVHRDFKPENVMMGLDGRARVLDFGLARDANDQRTQQSEDSGAVSSASGTGASLVRVTATGVALGTPAYMAPEQHRGEQTTPASDQFSFCVAVYEALYGVRPFEGGTRVAIYTAMQDGRRAAVPGAVRLPRRVTGALDRGLSLRPSDRFASMEALLSALDVDRRRRVGLAGVSLIGAVLAGAGVVAGLAMRGDDAQAVAPCEVLRDQVDGALPGVWDDERREQLERAFAATGAPFADRSWAALRSGVDGWVQSLDFARLDACEAHHVRGEQSAELLDLRTACMDRRVMELSVLVDLLARADVSVVQNAVKMTRALPALEPCGDARWLRRDAPQPTAEQSPEVARARARIAEANALLMAAHYEPGLAVAEEAVAVARGSGFRPVVTEALHQQGALEILADGLMPGVAHLEQAAADASRDDDDILTARSAEFLAMHAFHRLGDVEQGRRWLLQAEVAYERVGRLESPEVERRLLGIEGNLDRRAGHLEIAEDKLRRVLEGQREAARRDPGPSAELAVADAALNLAAVLQDSARHEPALALHREALEMLRRLLGPRHPGTARQEHNVGTVLQALGRHDEARAYHERTLQVWGGGEGSPSRWAGAAHVALTDIDFREGDTDGALEHARQAQQIYQATLPADHPDLASAWNTLGVAYFGVRRLEDSVQAYRQALAGYERAYGADHLEVAAPASNLGESLLALGRFAEALPHFERAERIWTRELGERNPALAYPLKGRGLAQVGTGEPALARDALQRAWELSSPHAPHERGEIAVGLALAWASRDSAEASRWAKEARALLADEAGAARLVGLVEALGDRGRSFESL